MPVIPEPERSKIYTRIKHQLGAPLRSVELEDEMMDSLMELAIQDYEEYIQQWLIDSQCLVNLVNLNENEVRAATVRAIGPVSILTIDSRNLLRRIHEDPYFAYRLVREMSTRVRRLGTGYAYFSTAAFENPYEQNSNEALPR